MNSSGQTLAALTSTPDVTRVALTVATSGAAAHVALLESGKRARTNSASMQAPLPFPACLRVALGGDQRCDKHRSCRKNYRAPSVHRVTPACALSQFPGQLLLSFYASGTSLAASDEYIEDAACAASHLSISTGASHLLVPANFISGVASICPHLPAVAGHAPDLTTPVENEAAVGTDQISNRPADAAADGRAKRRP